ncbi:hypothetical protein QTJ16_002083 [Diplocarpon rosae]|uniref:Uncharacterized protein n=1 Tax=Diplocarpon rosae TaxID=946125 RepID=A0AAD9WF22_9HELO|nr:hypothetical protein QTJ16_002083 [Diplocarpon rosae]PBP23054.1 hypothetical protein BUE80_DR005708 [Diplocarpon rosae]
MASEKARVCESGKTKKTLKPKKATKKTPPPTTFKSQEFVQDSDDDDSEQQKDDSDEETDGSEVFSRVKSVEIVSKANGKLPAPSGSSSSSEGESESDGQSSDAEDDLEVGAQPSSVIVEPTKQPTNEPTKRTVSVKAPPPFHPPTGFVLAELQEESNASKLLESSSLEGKQIWYFTAPASVPISSIKEMSLSDAKDGKAILSYKNNDYGFTKDSIEDKTYTKIMVPSSSDKVYKSASKSINRVLHLRQIIRGPTTENTSRATVPTKKLVRQQPKGLQMRFKPIGFGTGETGRIGSASPEVSDVEMEVSLPLRRASRVSDSDEGMSDALPVPKISHSRKKSSNTSASAISEKGPSLKRKYSEGEKKSKHSSSSIMSSIDHGELKQSKKKQTEFQKSTAASLSVSNESHQASAPYHDFKPPAMPLVSTTPIPLPKPLTPNSSVTESGPEIKPSKRPIFTENHHSSPKNSSRSKLLSTQGTTQARDPSLTGERQKKPKKLKHKGT